MDEVSGYAGGGAQGIKWVDLYVSCKALLLFFFWKFIRIK